MISPRKRRCVATAPPGELSATRTLLAQKGMNEVGRHPSVERATVTL